MPPATPPAALAMARCHRIGLWLARSWHIPIVGQLSSSSILARYVPRKPADGKEAGHSRNEQGSLLYALLSRLSRAGRDRQSGGEMPTRTFIAIELGDAARAALARTIAALARELPGVRFVEPASLHLSLAFLGDLDDAQLEQATQATAAAAQVSAPLSRTGPGLGSFGPPHAPRVILAGVGGKLHALAETQRALADELAARGFAREERPFAPHLTLVRLNA